ncbi:hypothetical protein BS78_02G333400 [Paspalum vaginatum]|nr:hypothetical protein BS78_02G333400 [Paspalum vaginatum]
MMEKKLEYQGGQEAMSYIERDKVSLPEVMGHLRDHCSVAEGTLLHWLFPGKELHNGLRVLLDDKVCLYMSECIVDGGVAYIYVKEGASINESAEKGSHVPSGSDFEDELVDIDVVDEGNEVSEEDEGAGALVGQPPPRCESREEIERQIKRLQAFYNSPSKYSKEVIECKDVGGSKKAADAVNSDSSSDSDYFPIDELASEEEDEAGQIKNKFKEFKKKLKGEGACLDDFVLENSSTQATSYVDLEGGSDETPCEQSDEYESVEENNTPSFEIGMKFIGKQEFKEAIMKYRLSERNVIKFTKDDDIRVRCYV